MMLTNASGQIGSVYMDLDFRTVVVTFGCASLVYVRFYSRLSKDVSHASVHSGFCIVNHSTGSQQAESLKS